MRHHFFIPPSQIGPNEVMFVGEQARQIGQVLRMKAGDELVVLDNTGWEYEVRLTAVASKQATAVILHKSANAREPRCQLTLYMALLKREKFEWVLQKGTEIGVTQFVPMITQRTLSHSKELKAGKQERWQKILTEAAEQSGRGRVPILQEACPLSQALANHGAGQAFMPWEEATAVGLATAVRAEAASVALFIGPEGGFTAVEVALAQEVGVQAVTLGRRILRAETAALVASTLVLQQTGDLA